MLRATFRIYSFALGMELESVRTFDSHAAMQQFAVDHHWSVHNVEEVIA